MAVLRCARLGGQNRPWSLLEGVGVVRCPRQFVRGACRVTFTTHEPTTGKESGMLDARPDRVAFEVSPSSVAAIAEAVLAIVDDDLHDLADAHVDAELARRDSPRARWLTVGELADFARRSWTAGRPQSG